MTSPLPRVATLTYRLTGPKEFRLHEQPAFECDLGDFRAALKGDELTLSPIADFASEDDAVEAAGSLLRLWELELGLTNHADLGFRLERCIVRRGNVVVYEGRTMYATPRLGHRKFRIAPPPEPGPNAALAARLWVRHRRYVAGEEPLPANAYFILGMIEEAIGAGKDKRRQAAKRFGVSLEVLQRIGRLSSEGGTFHIARKASGSGQPFQPGEYGWLETAILAVIDHLAYSAPEEVLGSDLRRAQRQAPKRA